MVMVKYLPLIILPWVYLTIIFTITMKMINLPLIIPIIFHAFHMDGMIHRLLQGDAHGALVRLGRLPGLATALGPVVRQHLGTRGRGSTSHEKSWEKWGFHGISWGLMGFNGISLEIHWDLNGFKKYTTKQNLDLRCMGLSEND